MTDAVATAVTGIIMATATVNTPNVLLAKIVGAVLVLVGILGFLPQFNPTLIIFGVNVLHNIVHLATGAILLAAGFIDGGTYARVTNQILGVVYLLVAILGFAGILVPTLLNTTADAIPHADNLLHTLLGVALAGVGFGVREPSGRGAMRTV
ncbi:MAG TPA: DUF4383 domain-containing protein [Candidatus Thermoplasmatota archaeon]|nr:DUF4383 domain-containing protein [Candidatus Thermoplasmatota archaeon]